jgi:hypothetical protein
LLIVAVFVGGCSLVVDFDRSLLLDGGTDGGSDAQVDAAVAADDDAFVESSVDAN